MAGLVPAEAHGDERGALLSYIEGQRAALREQAEGLTEEQAARRTTVSALSLSGLLKHASEVELGWLRMAQQKPNEHPEQEGSRENGFALTDGETIPQVLEFWDGVTKELEEFVRALPSLDETFPLPEAPWFPKGAVVSVRWMLLHLVEEFARHAGHADIIRESLDGRTVM
ncbi:DinB family protein [Streptomyces sp. MUM 203J]|uniref:DinB family protein n=1 Tax=Streptomyces sp. MUM 203J TaxID=2791990 RepID=UPI001F045A9E|nr:DinB family protein [Streptomyces sp. MUM 203J]MCH0540700.1 DinB family protein [Streptomyces sp. MUM 203J]